MDISLLNIVSKVRAEIFKFATNSHISQLCMVGFAYESFVTIGYCMIETFVSPELHLGLKYIRSQGMFA